MNLIRFLGFIKFLLNLLCVLLAFNVAASGWQKIDVSSTTMTVEDDNGQDRSIKPGCAFSYLPDEVGVPNQPFHFYFREGVKKDKTLIYFNGGGACWNGATCLTSLVAGERPVYNPTIEAENMPEIVGGIMDLAREDNPTREWNIIFIPYCTGDVHIGSRDMLYSDPLGFVNSGNPVMVQHRGFDNFMAVREWMKQNLDRKNTEKVLIAGSSAGAYGAVLNFSRLQSLYPNRTIVALLVDAAAGVFTQPFVNRVFNSVDGGPWGVRDTLATWIPGIDRVGSYDANTFYQQLVSDLSGHFRRDRFAFYSTAWDSIQAFFLNTMLKTDAGINDPDEWGNIPPESWLQWHVRMRDTFDGVAASRNVNYYIGAGVFHAALIDLFKPVPPDGYFYLENSAGGVRLTDWVRRLVTDDRNNELRDLMCLEDCQAPFAAE